MTKIVCLSDTHGSHRTVKTEECDILIFAGDYTAADSLNELSEFLEWLSSQPAKHKIMIAGNHDKVFESNPGLASGILASRPGIYYLQDSLVTIKDHSGKNQDIKIWGSPVTPRFFNWAFNRDRGTEIKRHWDMIPNGIDILITHGPAYSILDVGNELKGSLGCRDLLGAINRIKPKLHVFGHIHGSGGRKMVTNLTPALLTSVNAAIANEDYLPSNKPVVVFL